MFHHLERQEGRAATGAHAASRLIFALTFLADQLGRKDELEEVQRRREAEAKQAEVDEAEMKKERLGQEMKKRRKKLADEARK